MKFDLIEELKWRGMIHDTIPGTQEHLNEAMRSIYIGFDPTGDSLHVGSLVPIMMLKQLQLAGHKPVVLIGGATGMIGDPSGKSAERNLLDMETLNNNVNSIKNQLSKFLDFENGDNKAVIVNNYEWMKNMSFLDFIRDVGKNVTVNYMMSKQSVKNRIETGISFTEFSYQLLQGYDFLHLFRENDVTVQMGGSDQWGNLTTGTELIRKMTEGGNAFAATCPLMTKADGTKFGKTEKGSVWLDPTKTSPYEFYQFWLNSTDEDAPKYLRTFTLLSESEIEDIETLHSDEPHKRIMQTRLAEELTVFVHSENALKVAQATSKILFGKSTNEDLESLSNEELLEVFSGVPQVQLDKSELLGKNITEIFHDLSGFLKSRGEVRREVKGNSLSVNKSKVGSIEDTITEQTLINDKFVLLQKGKKNYFLVETL